MMAKTSGTQTKKTTKGRGRPKKDFANLEKKLKETTKKETPGSRSTAGKKRGRPPKKTNEKKSQSTSRGRGRPKKDFANLEKKVDTTKKTTKKKSPKKTANTKTATKKTGTKKKATPTKKTTKNTSTKKKNATKKTEKQTKKTKGFVTHKVQEKQKGSKFASWLLFFSFLLLLFAVFQTVFENIREKQTNTIIDQLRTEIAKGAENINLIEEEQDPLKEELKGIQQKIDNPSNKGFAGKEGKQKMIEEDILYVAETGSVQTGNIETEVIQTGTVETNNEITSFQECVDAGFPVMESYPRQCSDETNTYTEDIETTTSNTLEEEGDEEEQQQNENKDIVVEEENTTENEENTPTTPEIYDLPEISFSRAYNKGEQHPDIKTLQQFLANEGIYTGEMDSTYSPATINAVFEFQKSQGLVTDESDPRIRGYFGPSTRYRVNEIIKEKY